MDDYCIENDMPRQQEMAAIQREKNREIERLRNATIQNVIDYLSKQYCQGDGSIGWQKGYSPEERIRTAINMLKKLV